MKQLLGLCLILPLFMACSQEQQVESDGMLDDIQAANEKILPYLQVKDRRYILDLSSSEALKLGISKEFYNTLISDIDMVNQSLDESEEKGIPTVVLEPSSSVGISDFSVRSIKTRSEGSTSYPTITMGYNVSDGSAKFTPASNKLTVIARGTSPAWSVVLSGDISVTLSGFMYTEASKEVSAQAGKQISVDARKHAGNGAIVTVSFK